MKRFLVFALTVILAVSLLSGCKSDKPGNDNKPAPSPTPLTDAGASDASESDDVTKSETAEPVEPDVTESETTEETAQIYGTWRTENYSRIITFMDDGYCVYTEDENNVMSAYSLEDELLKIAQTGELYTVTRLEKKLLILTNPAGTETEYKKLSQTKKLKTIEAASLVGSWACRIEDDKNDDYVEFLFELHEDGTAVVTMDSAGEKDERTDAVWSVSKGVLKFEGESFNSALKVNILAQPDADTVVIAMEGAALIVVRATAE